MFSRIEPEAKSTSRNSAGWIGVSPPLIRMPLALNPPGRLLSVPASTSCRIREVPDFAKEPSKCTKPKA